jgi:hypothetical protein
MGEKRYTLFKWDDANLLSATVLKFGATKQEIEDFFTNHPEVAVRPRDYFISEQKEFSIHVEFDAETHEDDEISVTLTIEE